MILGTLAVLISGALITMLALRDPKRLRAEAHVRGSIDTRTAFSPSTRRTLALLALVPGLVLACIGQWWAFLIWLGASCVAGWLFARAMATASFSKAR